jgi:ethanolamine utilization protein EutN
MRIATVLGTVTLGRQHPNLSGARLKVAVPLSCDELASGSEPRGDSIVVWDEFGAGHGSRIAVSEGSEAAQPFRPDLKPIDAYCAAILDDIHVEKG